MVDVDVSNRAGAVGGFSSDGSFAIAQKRHFGSDPKRYHRHFDDGDEFGDGLVPQEHARHYREGVVRARRLLSLSSRTEHTLIPPARHRRDAPRSRPAQAATQDGVGAASSRARARPGPARYTMNPPQPRVYCCDGILTNNSDRGFP